MIPLELAFSMLFLYSENMIPATLLFTLFLFLDILISFNTAYYEYGSIVKERGKIFIYRVSKCWGLEMFSVLYLIIIIFLDAQTLAFNSSVIKVGFLTFFS